MEKKNIKCGQREFLTQQGALSHMAGALRKGWEGAQEATKSMGFAGSHRSDPMGEPVLLRLLRAASHMQDRA